MLNIDLYCCVQAYAKAYSAVTLLVVTAKNDESPDASFLTALQSDMALLHDKTTKVLPVCPRFTNPKA